MNKFIDHTNLKANATRDDIQCLCDEAKKHDFASVCVNGYWVSFCAEQLKQTSVKVCTVVGFPLGAMSTSAKAYEAGIAIQDGADEVDMVLNIGELKQGNRNAVWQDIMEVRKACQGKCLKVIFECALLTKEEIKEACAICVQAKADFVKTSTGFSIGGATIEDVKLMKQEVHGACLIKAAGGIREKRDMQAMIEAGADRIGTSNGVSLVKI